MHKPGLQIFILESAVFSDYQLHFDVPHQPTTHVSYCKCSSYQTVNTVSLGCANSPFTWMWVNNPTKRRQNPWRSLLFLDVVGHWWGSCLLLMDKLKAFCHWNNKMHRCHHPPEESYDLTLLAARQLHMFLSPKTGVFWCEFMVWSGLITQTTW